MSKIAEQKGLEVYPKSDFHRVETRRRNERSHYIKGYDQAMKDFLKKAEGYLNYTLYDTVEIKVFGTLIPDIIDKKKFIGNFKNYMQNE